MPEIVSINPNHEKAKHEINSYIMRIIILVPITFISYHVVIYNCYYMLLPHKTTVKTLVKTKRHCHIHDMNMERNSELQEIDIKNGTFQYFDDIININHKKN